MSDDAPQNSHEAREILKSDKLKKPTYIRYICPFCDEEHGSHHGVEIGEPQCQDIKDYFKHLKKNLK